uniref:Uncharacterized protein n=1 Tax=viral metagenome TaxID=1070528 RepID=A0A6C0CUR3_9ZZZZ
MLNTSLKPEELNSGTNNILPAPQVKGMLASSPMESAYVAGKQNGELLTSLSKVGGKRKNRKTKYIGGAGNIVIPTIPVPYNDQMAGSQSVIGQFAGNASTILQASENSKYDKVTLVGGRSRRKSRKSRKSRKTRKSRKSRK